MIAQRSVYEPATQLAESLPSSTTIVAAVAACIIPSEARDARHNDASQARLDA
jgi:hypothetical protein